MIRPGTRLNILALGAFAAICIGALGYLAVNIGLRYPGESGYQLRAEFQDTAGLVPQDEVRISGVKVGTVTGVGPAGDGNTLVAMELVPSFRVRGDVRAVVRPKSLLGTQYVELVRTPQSTSPFLSSGATIPLARTGQSVQIDDVLNNMDPETRAAFSDSLQQLGVALDGRSADLNQSLASIDQLTANLRPLAQVGDVRQEELARILVDLDTIMQALADEQDSLGRIVDSGNTVFSGIAQRDQDLGGAIVNADQFLGSLDQAFSTAGVTSADRASLAGAPATITANSHTLSLTNPGIDQIVPELLLGQVNYPSDQLDLTQSDSLALSREWISAFFQHDVNGNSFRITNVTATPGTPASGASGSSGSPGAIPGGAPIPGPASSPPPDPLCALVGGVC